MMLVRRSALCIVLFLLASVCARAQRLDVGFVVGESRVSDSTTTFTVPCAVSPSSCPPPAFTDHVQTGRQLFYESSLAVRLINLKAVALALEIPAAGITSQNLKLPRTPAFANGMTSIFVTPSLRVSLASDSIVSPWVSAGGGWARYTVDPEITTNKGALQFGGGADFRIGMKRLRLRAEFRDFVTGDPSFGLVSGPFLGTTQGGFRRHNVLIGGGVAFHFGIPSVTK
jgi:hypothetical protein